VPAAHSGLGAPSDDHRVAVAAREESVPWLEPAPDTLLGTGDPATVVAARAGVRLAFIAALQLLPARQRAVLTLRDVLAFRTEEVAAMLDSTTAAVDSALRRARAKLAESAPTEQTVVEPTEPAIRTLLDNYVDAFTRADAGALITLLRTDVEMEMPPIPTWFTGRDAVVGFLINRVLSDGHWRLLPARANGQPAFVTYARTATGDFTAYGLQVLTLTGSRIARITSFNDPKLVSTFGFAPAIAQ
jgi:RNA polymerase sigma-70 factor (TIGR02960 family)